MSLALTVVFAIILLAVILQDAFEVMLLPRRVRRRLRLTTTIFEGAWTLWRMIGTRLSPGRRRETFLSHFGALSMLMLFGVWALGLIVGFGTLEWALQQPSVIRPEISHLAEQIYMSGVTFFTLGYGDVVPHTRAARFVAVFEAGTGIGYIAVVIGYLPVLYQLFARREAHVIQLDARAGSPPSAYALLERHGHGGETSLNDFLREWEVWGAELLESHLSYPMLAYYRSQHDNQSWLAALTCIMDACALILVGAPEISAVQARMTFAMARQILVEISRSFSIRPSSSKGKDRLDTTEYERLEQALIESGVAWEGGPEAGRTLASLRATYEPLSEGLSRYLLLPIPTWLPHEYATDHWEGGHRGLIASRLIEQLAARQETSVDERSGRWMRRTR